MGGEGWDGWRRMGWENIEPKISVPKILQRQNVTENVIIVVWTRWKRWGNQTILTSQTLILGYA